VGYSITVYRRELTGTPASKFAEDPDAVPVFTAAQRKQLREQLELRGYEAKKKSKDNLYGHFAYPDVEARLTDRQLTFSSGLSTESVYTILEVGTELGMTNGFALFNPQEGSWTPKPKKKKKK
jgi:hypothetical protein